MVKTIQQDGQLDFIRREYNTKHRQTFHELSKHFKSSHGWSNAALAWGCFALLCFALRGDVVCQAWSTLLCFAGLLTVPICSNWKDQKRVYDTFEGTRKS
jgi:hypothetical protein